MGLINVSSCWCKYPERLENRRRQILGGSNLERLETPNCASKVHPAGTIPIQASSRNPPRLLTGIGLRSLAFNSKRHDVQTIPC
jgi:hypothetical protein